MGSHPLNLTLRFLLELAALISVGYWGWTQHEGVSRWLWMLGLPLLVAIAWGTFAVPNDPSRSGEAPVQIAGFLRLILELLILGGGAYALVASRQTTAGWVLGGLVLFHYLISYDRILWLLKQ